MRVVYSLVSILLLLLVSMFGYADAAEIHKNGFGGITPFNTTGLTIFNDSLKRSFDYEASSLVLSAEFSILETNGDIRDFSLFDNDLTTFNTPRFVSSRFRTGLETLNHSNQFANTSHSASLDMETTNVSMIWWGQTRNTSIQYILGKGCSAGPLVYGILLLADNTISTQVADSGCVSDGIINSNLPIGGLLLNRTYSIGVVIEDNPWGADVHFWLDGQWIYNETSVRRIGDTGGDFWVGRSFGSAQSTFCNCTHDEVLVFQERLDNETMRLLTTQQHNIVIRSGPATTTQGFGGLFLALPWLIVFGLLGWLFFIIFMSWKKAFD